MSDIEIQDDFKMSDWSETETVETIQSLTSMSVVSSSCDAETQTDPNNNSLYKNSFSSNQNHPLSSPLFKNQTISENFKYSPFTSTNSSSFSSSSKKQQQNHNHLSGIWLQSNRRYSSSSQNKLPRRVNHASAFKPGGDKIYILGGFHQFSQHGNYQYASELDCYEFDCLTQKTRTIKAPRKIEDELSTINEHIENKGKPLDFPMMRYAEE